MVELIKKYLLKIVDDIDAGNSNLTEEEAVELVDTLKRLTDREKRLSKYEACRYLNISRATFDNYVREGRLPRGKHETGFKELSWSRKDLDSFVQKYNNDKQVLRSRIASSAEQNSKFCLECKIVKLLKEIHYDNTKESNDTNL